MKKPRYGCNTCSFETDVRVVMKDHAAVLGHFGWTDNEVVKGHSLRVTRLDAEGKPTGEPVEVSGRLVAFPETEDEEKITTYTQYMDPLLKRFTMDLTILTPKPEVLALVFGIRQPRWWRILPLRIRRRLIMRRLAR